MPASNIKALARKSGKSEKEVEKMWDEAKKIATETLGKGKEDTDQYDAYVTGIVKNMLGLKEATLDIKEFLEFKGSVKEFIDSKIKEVV